MNDDTASWSRFVSVDGERRGRHAAFWSELHAVEDTRRLLAGLALVVGSAVGLVAAGLSVAWGLR